MLIRIKQTERAPRWRRPGRGVRGRDHAADRASAIIEVASPVARESGVRSCESDASWLASAHERRNGGASEDRALYTCECGYLFEALVSTSVGCPHCGSEQAW